MWLTLLIHGVGWEIHNAFYKILYKIFIKFPLYFVAGTGEGIRYLSGSEISDLIFKVEGHKFGLDPKFIDFLLIAATLILIFGCVFLLRIALQHTVQKEIGGLIGRVVSGLVLIILIPIIFFSANFLVVNLISILLKGKLSGLDLADQVGRLGWTDNRDHSHWHFYHVPNFNQGYSLFLGTFGSFFCLIIFFLLGLTLVKRIFDLFLLYVISPVVISTAASGARWSKVNLWKDLVIARFISSLGIVLAITLFLQLSPQFFAAGRSIQGPWYQKASLSLLFLCGASVATLQSQQLFSSMVSGTVGIQDGLGMLTTFKVGTGAIQAGALGVVGLGRKLRRGKRNVNVKVSQTKKYYSNSDSKQKTYSGSKRFQTRIGASAVLGSAGLVAGISGQVTSRGKHWRNTDITGKKNIISTKSKTKK